MHTLVHPATPSTASRMETHPDTQSRPAQEGRITTRQGGMKLGGPYCRRPSMPIRAHGPTQARKRAAREHVQPTLLKVQSTSPKSGHFRLFSAKWTAVWDRRPVTTSHQQQSRATPSRAPATASSGPFASGDFHRHKGNDSAQRIPQRVLGTVELVSHLEVHPESRGRTEVAGQPHRRISRNPALPVDDFIDTAGRNTDSNGELVLRDSEALDEVLHEDFTRVNRSNLSGSQRFQPLLGQRLPGRHASRTRSPRAARVCPNKRAHTIALHRKIRQLRIYQRENAEHIPQPPTDVDGQQVLMMSHTIPQLPHSIKLISQPLTARVGRVRMGKRIRQTFVPQLLTLLRLIPNPRLNKIDPGSEHKMRHNIIVRDGCQTTRMSLWTQARLLTCKILGDRKALVSDKIVEQGGCALTERPIFPIIHPLLIIPGPKLPVHCIT